MSLLSESTVVEIETRLGVSFRDRRLLEQALAHTSYLNEHPEVAPDSNERLEFLGDALIDLVVAHTLFLRYPGAPEGDLTALRAALVRKESLARVARRLELGRFLLMGQGEQASGGRERESNLASALEAVVAAAFLDQGFRQTRAFVLRVLGPELKRASRGEVPKDVKSRLQELVQSKGKPTPSYRMVEAIGPSHDRRFTVEVCVGSEVVGVGRGKRRVEAEKAAAAAALKALGAS